MTAPSQKAAGARSVRSKESEAGAYHAGTMSCPDMLITSQLNVSSRTLGGTHSWALGASARHPPESTQARNGDGQRRRRQTMTAVAHATTMTGAVNRHASAV